MPIKRKSTVPQWVRSIICVVGCLSVPALVLASYLGATINFYLAAAVGLYAIWTANFAFSDLEANSQITSLLSGKISPK